jgi:alkyl hydroperoxide reductase subunit AhpC
MKRVWSPAFLEWVRWKSDPALMSYPTVADQPLEIAIQFDYLVKKYGRDHESAARKVYEQQRDQFLKMVYGKDE